MTATMANPSRRARDRRTEVEDWELGKPGVLSNRAYDLWFVPLRDPESEALLEFPAGVAIHRAADGTMSMYRPDGRVVLPDMPHGILTRRLLEIGYRHAEDSGDWFHEFQSGVSVTNTGKRLHIYRPDKKRVWGTF